MLQPTSITIQLVQGKNYISFPASSESNFRTIFTDSGMINDIGIDTSQNKMFYRYDPISDNYVLIDLDLEYIEQGKGYYLYISSIQPGDIIYEGTEYTMTFEQFKSQIIEGWNLLGVGKDTIVTQLYCKIYDPKTMIPVIILEPKHSYLVNYDNCMMPTISYGNIIGVTASFLVAVAVLKQFKII